jgi:hypothetical protein
MAQRVGSTTVASSRGCGGRMSEALRRRGTLWRRCSQGRMGEPFVGMLGSMMPKQFGLGCAMPPLAVDATVAEGLPEGDGRGWDNWGCERGT